MILLCDVLNQRSTSVAWKGGWGVVVFQTVSALPCLAEVFSSSAALSLV